MAKEDEKDTKDGEGSEQNSGPRKSGSKITLSNVTMSPIQIKLTRLPGANVKAVPVEDERVITLPPLMVKPKTFDGELAPRNVALHLEVALADPGDPPEGRHELACMVGADHAPASRVRRECRSTSADPPFP